MTPLHNIHSRAVNPQFSLVIASSESATRNGIVKTLTALQCRADWLLQSFSVSGAAAHIAQFSPCLAFLDHRLMDGSGFDALRRFRLEKRWKEKIAFVYLSSRPVEGLANIAAERGALAYLEAPFSEEEIRGALQKFYLDFGIRSQVSAEVLQAALEAPEPTPLSSAALQEPPPLVVHQSSGKTKILPATGAVITPARPDCILHLFVKHGNERKQITVYPEEIQYLRGERNDVHFYLMNAGEGKEGNNPATQLPYRVTGTLKTYREKLYPCGFVQVERSFLVNLHWVRRIEGKALLLHNGDILPIGDSFRPFLLEAMERHARQRGGGGA